MDVSTFATYGIKPNQRPVGDLEMAVRCWVRWWRAWRDEFRTNRDVAWRTRLRAWRLGFHSKNHQLFELDRNRPDEYLGDYEYEYHSYRFNGFFSPIVGSKWVLPQVLSTVGVPSPPVVALVLSGILHDAQGRRQGGPLLERLRQWCAEHEALVLRPHWSGSGEGVFFLSRSEGGWRLNWQEAPAPVVEQLVGSLDRYMLTAWVAQADYARGIFPRTTNTLRVLTLRDDDGPFVAAVVHRFGTESSFPIDNFQTGFGGICAAVDVEAGRLGPAVAMSTGAKLVRYTHHPQTGAAIEGVAIPHLQDALSGVLRGCECFPEARLIGWDVLMTNDGYRVIEGNSPPGIVVWQVQQPLLKNPRNARFFSRQGFRVAPDLLG